MMAPQRENSQPETLELGGARAPFGGLNLLDSETAIADNEFSALKGALSIGSELRGIPVSTSLYTTATPFYWATCENRGGTPYAVLMNTDGSVTAVDLITGAGSSIGAPGTISTGATSVGGLDGYPQTTVWSNADLLLVDPANGLFSWSGSGQLSLVDATVKGSAITTYRGRVWVALDRSLQFSAPGGYNDYTVADGAGAFSIIDADLQGPLLGLASMGTYLFYLGQYWTGVTSYLNVQSGITLFDVQSFAPGVGPVAPGAFDPVDGELFLAGAQQLWPLNGPSPPDVSEPLGTSYYSQGAGIASVAHGLVHGLSAVGLYSPLNGRIFVLCRGRWGETVAPANVLRIATAVLNGEPHLIAFWGAGTSWGISDLTPVASISAWQPMTVHSRLFDFGAPLMGKTAVQAGVFGTTQANADPEQQITLGLVNEGGQSETRPQAISAPNGHFFTWSGFDTLGKHIGLTLTTGQQDYETRIGRMAIQVQIGEDW